MTAPNPTVGVCIPTLNPGRWIDRMLDALRPQQKAWQRLLVIDSSSDDDSVDRFTEIGADIVTIPRATFDHGGTRNQGVQELGTDVVVFLTQDAIPASDTAIAALADSVVAEDTRAVAFGRQLPAPGASPIARAHRHFNYGTEAFERSAADIPALGVRAAFNSNSFAAYRADAVRAVGGFPSPVIGSEDRWIAARFLQSGWTVAYVPDAAVFHSHDYSLSQDFRRYFDIGVFHSTEHWFDALLGEPQAEGLRLVRSQVQELRDSDTSFARARVVAHAGASWVGYRVGRHHRWLPRPLAARCSTAPAFFTSLSPLGHPARRNPGS